jgi:spoIIIJ-associated protein
MNDVAQAARTIADFLQNFTLNSGLRLRYRVKLRGAKGAGGAGDDTSADAAAEEGGGPGTQRCGTLSVEFSGPDTPILTGRNGDVLNALEHIAAKILRLDAEEHDLVSFDADSYKANRDRQMRASAASAVAEVRASGEPHSFPAMSSRERRMLHMLLAESGLPTASSGEGAGRFVVLYPEGADTSEPFNEAPRAPRPDPERMRNTFRHR